MSPLRVDRRSVLRTTGSPNARLYENQVGLCGNYRLKTTGSKKWPCPTTGRGLGAPWARTMALPPRSPLARRRLDRPGSGYERPGDSETDVAVAVGREAFRAERRTQESREVDPGAAAQYAAAAPAGDPCRTVRRGADVSIVPAVLDPLPHVAVHVVQAERVRRERAHRRCLPAVPPAPAATTVCSVFADLVSRVVLRRRPRTRRLLPLRLARQPVALAGLRRQPGDVVLHHVPRHVDH